MTTPTLPDKLIPAVIGVLFVVATGTIIASATVRAENNSEMLADEETDTVNSGVYADTQTESDTSSSGHSTGGDAKKLIFATDGLNSARIYTWDLQVQSPVLLSSFSFSYAATPLFIPFDESSFVIYRYVTEDRSVLMDTQGQVVSVGETNFDPSNIDPQTILVSPSGSKAAYSKYVSDNTEQFVIQDLITNAETSKDIPDLVQPVVGEVLAPLYWSDDEHYVYCSIMMPTEGYDPRLLKVDAQSLEWSDVDAVVENDMAWLSIDSNGVVYGTNNKELGWYMDTGPTYFYRYDLKTETLNKIELGDLQIYTVGSPSPSGRYVLMSDIDSNLWIYDQESGEKTMVTDMIVNNDTIWIDDDSFVFVGGPRASYEPSTFYQYDADTNLLRPIYTDTEQIITLIDVY